jgi:hypothetical protein
MIRRGGFTPPDLPPPLLLLDRYLKDDVNGFSLYLGYLLFML